jgi:ketopantoate reductase
VPTAERRLEIVVAGAGALGSIYGGMLARGRTRRRFCLRAATTRRRSVEASWNQASQGTRRVSVRVSSVRPAAP